ncbi:MAG: EamA family transporter [Acidobacteriota bacterium]|nr:EamA family transporter [Acidobacteriota bacterium]
MPDTAARTAPKAYLALAAVCFFWGTTYLGIRIALESFPPAVLVSMRFLLSGGLMVAASILRGAHLPRGRELAMASLCGVLILGIGNGALAYSELLIPSGLASLFITISPFWLVGIEALVAGGAPLHGPTILGMIVGFSGTALLLTPALGSHGLRSGAVAGFAITQIGCVSWSLGSILQKRQPDRAHPVVIGAVQQLAAGIAILPFALLLPSHPIAWTMRGVAAVLYLVTFGSIVGYSAYAYALDKLPVAIVSIYPYVNAIVAVSLGWLFYREPFGMGEAIAMLVIFTGVAIVKWQGTCISPTIHR